MKNFRTCLWQITAKTNLHVGNEDSTSYGIIDKAVQRDVLTELPCINASSLKGAINEFCCADGIDSSERKRIFGSDKLGKGGESTKGNVIFYDAHILFLPEQNDHELFTYITSEKVLEQMNNRLALFNKKVDLNNYERNGKRKYSKKDDFGKKCNNLNLPIIARNVLVNGESKNLWYEQVVPAETVFYAITQEPEPDRNKGEKSLSEYIDGRIIQIGANATIGYGYCLFKNINIQDLSEKK